MNSLMASRYGFLFCACLFASAVHSQSKKDNAGILYGSNHAFAFQAPKGWVLDNHSAVSQGLDAVFYPVGQTWEDSPVMAYARVRDRKEDRVNTAADVVHLTLTEFHHHGNPGSKAVKAASIRTETGRIAEVYYFTGDKWRNYEAAAYIVEPKTINFFVMNAKKKALFTQSLPAFKSLVKSYIYLGDNPLAAQKTTGGTRKQQ